MFEDYTYDQRIAFCRAMANIIAADRKVTLEEKSELNGLIIGTGLSPSDEQVAAAISAELSNPTSLTEILKPVTDKNLRAALFRMLIEVSCADGDVAPEERSKILEAAAAFGLEKKAAGDLIDWTVQAIQHE